jgi:acyl-CoA synthetase (AMP-forming)/AMP-acid ligase II
MLARETQAELDRSGLSKRPAPWKKWRAFLFGRKRLTMANFTDRLAEVYEDRTLFILDRPLETPYFQGRVLSFRDVNRLVTRAASLLTAIGVRRGDRVALATLNRIELAFVEFGAQRIGAIPVPLNYMLTKDELRELVERSGARVLVTDRTVFEQSIKERSSLPTLEDIVMVSSKEPPAGVLSFDRLMASAGEELPPVDLEDDAPAIVFFTAGTTGTPKGAVLTSGGLMDGFRRYAMLASILPTPTKRLALLVMPLAHTSGHQNLLIQMALATPCIVLGSFDPSHILDLIERHRVTMFAGIPTMYRMLLAAGADSRDLRSVRLWGGGGDAFPAELVEKLRGLTARRIGPFKRRAAFVTGYGMAETAGQVSITPPFAAGDHCVGWLLPGVKWRIVDEAGRDVKKGEVGQLLLKTKGVMREYWSDPEGTRNALQDGWFKSGDLVRRGRFGLMYFVSREKEMIKVGGYSVFPAEIEKVLDKHPDVERSVVVGLPHPTKGELPVAGVVLKEAARITEDELLAWAKEHIAPYRVPRRIVFTDDIPTGFGMKPLRRQVRARFLEMGIVVKARSDDREKASAAQG